jgi:hypothetical protein
VAKIKGKELLLQKIRLTMKFSPYVTDLLKQKSGKDFRLTSDCEYLALDIESVTGEHIGVNTLKRLLGFIDDEREPRTSTLDVIARYLGFENWDILKTFDDRSNSSFESSSEEIRVNDLSVGQCIQISYLPDRQIELAYLGANRFRVKESANSKLLAGDEMTITHIVQGYPLLVSEVVRDGQSLGAFTAGKAQGIRFKFL